VRACVRACVLACVRACVRACVCGQVRRRACETIADAVVFGDAVPYGWIASCAEDGTEVVKSKAIKLLRNALFGRGSVISERNYR
jgi:hypothetical protein